MTALSAGTIDYEDTGGEGPAIVLLGGLPMDASLWNDVVARMLGAHRCIAPTLPVRAHPMGTDADLSPPGIPALVSELLERLGMDDASLVGSGTGGGIVRLIAGERSSRVGRIVLVSCGACDDFPPGVTATTLEPTGKVPAALLRAVDGATAAATRQATHRRWRRDPAHRGVRLRCPRADAGHPTVGLQSPTRVNAPLERCPIAG